MFTTHRENTYLHTKDKKGASLFYFVLFYPNTRACRRKIIPQTLSTYQEKNCTNFNKKSDPVLCNFFIKKLLTNNKYHDTIKIQ